MIYYLIRFILVILLLILQAYLSGNLVYIFVVSYEQLAKLHSNDSWINPSITSNECTKNSCIFCFQLGNHSMINNRLNNYHNTCLRDDESLVLTASLYVTDNFLISNMK